MVPPHATQTGHKYLQIRQTFVTLRTSNSHLLRLELLVEEYTATITNSCIVKFIAGKWSLQHFNLISRFLIYWAVQYKFCQANLTKARQNLTFSHRERHSHNTISTGQSVQTADEVWQVVQHWQVMFHHYDESGTNNIESLAEKFMMTYIQ